MEGGARGPKDAVKDFLVFCRGSATPCRVSGLQMQVNVEMDVWFIFG